MTRVLSTAAAEQAVNRMHQIIDQGLVEQISALDREGRTLSDPNVWDGQLAASFRAEWPSTSQSLQRIRSDLDALRVRVAQVNAAIMAAGGNPG